MRINSYKFYIYKKKTLYSEKFIKFLDFVVSVCKRDLRRASRFCDNWKCELLVCQLLCRHRYVNVQSLIVLTQQMFPDFNAVCFDFSRHLLIPTYIEQNSSIHTKVTNAHNNNIGKLYEYELLYLYAQYILNTHGIGKYFIKQRTEQSYMGNRRLFNFNLMTI